MNTGIQGLLRILFLGLLCLGIAAALATTACSVPSLPITAQRTGEKPETNSERDRQVLEALLLHLLSDKKFNLTYVSRSSSASSSASKATIVLHPRTPEKTGMIQESQMRAETGGTHTLPPDAAQDLRQRNSKLSAHSSIYEAVAVSFTGWKFAAPIVVEDWEARRDNARKSGGSGGSGGTRRRDSNFDFEERHPRAKGWVRTYLPGYSKDGTRAFVRAWTGPSSHGATVTALLERNPSSGKWQVKWYRLAFYV